VSTSTVEVLPKKHVRKTLASILREKVAAAKGKVRGCKTHTSTCEAKRRKNMKSIQILWHYTGYLLAGY
jgi:hypothetical protein